MVRVLVGVVTYAGQQYCRELFFEFLCSLTSPELSFLIVTNSGDEDARDLEMRAAALRERGRDVTVLVDHVASEEPIEKIVSGRNRIRDALLASDAEYLLFLDSDGIGPRNMVETLLSHGKKLVTGYFLSAFTDQGKQQVRPVLWRQVDEGSFQQLHIAHVLKPRLLPIARSGLACSLIHRSILEEIPFVNPPSMKNGEDSRFYADCAEQGLQLYCDTRVGCWHIKFPPGDERNQLLNPLNYKLEVKKRE